MGSAFFIGRADHACHRVKIRGKPRTGELTYMRSPPAFQPVSFAKLSPPA